MTGTKACIALGSNLGDRTGHLIEGLAELIDRDGISLVSVSSFLETPPVGPPGQGLYVNACAVLRTTLSARELLEAMLEVETAHGRDRAAEQRWGPRTLDLDLIVFGDEIIDEPGLRVPHERLSERTFVLEPLAQIAPDLIVPGLGKSVAALRNELAARGASSDAAASV